MGSIILYVLVPLLALGHSHGGGPPGGDAPENCSTLGNGTNIAQILSMMPTPLPGNFFMLNNFAPMLDHADHPYSDLLRDSETGTSVRPFFTRIDVLRTPGVTEPLHYLAGDSVWSWQGGCPSTYLVIERSRPYTEGKSSTATASWHTIGPDVEDGEMTFSLVIKAGDLYAAFNSDECGTYIGVAIAPGLNMPPEIETPVVPDLKALFTTEALAEEFPDARDGGATKTVEQWLTDYGKPEPPIAEERRLDADPEAELKSRALSGHGDHGDRKHSCNVLGDTTAIASVLSMGATPLPGNYFSQQNIGTTVTHAKHPYSQFLRGTDDTRPFLTHIQVLKTPGVTEPLHYLAGNAIWSFQAGCAISYLVITRVSTETEGKYDVGDIAWNVLGMDVEGGAETFSIPIGAGDLYTGFNSDECHAFVKTSISPGLNSPPEIETPMVAQLKELFTEAALAKTFTDTRDDVTRSLAEFLETYGKPDANTNGDSNGDSNQDSDADGSRHQGVVSLPLLALLALFAGARASA